MVAAIDWCSHTTHEWIWLDSCLGFNSLKFQSISDCLPKREKEKRKDRRDRKCPAPTASEIGPCHTIIQISRTFRH